MSFEKQTDFLEDFDRDENVGKLHNLRTELGLNGIQKRFQDFINGKYTYLETKKVLEEFSDTIEESEKDQIIEILKEVRKYHPEGSVSNEEQLEAVLKKLDSFINQLKEKYLKINGK